MIHISEPSSAVIQALDAVAQGGERQAFVTQVEAIDWSTQAPDDLAHTIDLALRLELATLAIALATEGQRLFPAHPRLQHAARVLAPPVGRTAPAAPVQGLDDSRNWIRDHADAYRGQWVAVREGALLGAAPSLKRLLTALGPNHDRTNMIVTRVLQMSPFPALFDSGFASGMARYADHYPGQYDTARIVVLISVTGLPPLEAVVDTGAPWCILDPSVAELVDKITHDANAQPQALQTRWGTIEGRLHRVTISLLAEEGNSLEFETTLLVPTLPPGATWDRPNFIGLNNFLNRIRFAVDPNENVFYFGLA